jgi:hypothetical protein
MFWNAVALVNRAVERHLQSRRHMMASNATRAKCTLLMLGTSNSVVVSINQAAVAKNLTLDGRDRKKPCDHVAAPRRGAAPRSSVQNRGTAPQCHAAAQRCTVALVRGTAPRRRTMSQCCPARPTPTHTTPHEAARRYDPPDPNRADPPTLRRRTTRAKTKIPKAANNTRTLDDPRPADPAMQSITSVPRQP